MTNHEPKHPPADVPVVWLYSHPSGAKHYSEIRNLPGENFRHPDFVADDWTETPLYAHPPADMAGLDGLIERLLSAFVDEVDTWDNIDHLKGSIKRKGVQAMMAAVASIRPADHWLRLRRDHPVGWVGAIDTAVITRMEAACDEIRRLSAALGESHD